MTKKALSRLAAGCLCLAAAPESECGDLAADTVVADRVETPAIGPSAALSGVSLSADAAVSGALSVAGGTALRSGIPCLAPLGDVPMGCFTNAAGDAACAGAPAWWSTRGVTPAGAAANDRAAAVQGQVKWIALQAAAELDAALAAAGGAGPAVSALAASFSPSNNLLPVTLGQLKNTARPFHDRLMEVGIATGYPWSGPASDFALANAGQVKFLFSFDLSRDPDGDGMPDGWEASFGLDPLSGLSDGLAGWWQFREASGTNSVDLSGNGNDAFILFPDVVSRTEAAPVGSALRFSTNAPAPAGLVLWNKLGSAGEIANSEVGPAGTLAAGGFVSGPFGNAIELDMGQRFGCTFPAASLKTPRGCMEFWARLSGFPAQMPWSGGKPVLVGCPTPEGSPDCIIFYFNANNGGGDGGLCVSSSFGHTGTGPFGSWTYSGAIGGGDVAEWHHYAVSWDKDGIPGLSGGTRKVAVFVDGNLNSAPGTLWDAETFFDVPDGYVFGLLSHQGITEGRVAFDNLKVWNYAKTGFLDRFVEDTSVFTPGCNGGYVCVPGLSNAVLSSGFTAAAWVRAESYPPYATVLTKTGDHNVWGDGFSLYHEPGDSLSFYAGSWGEDTVAGGVSGTGVWHHVCGVYDGTDALLYIDGTLRGTRTNVAGIVANDDPLWIGSVFKDDRWLWHGDIADVRFYTSALSASQVNGLLEFAADPDGDGVPNLQEYARGTDPGDPASKNCTLYADSDIGGAQYDGFSPAVLSASRGPKATVQQALDTAFSGDAVELRGQSAFADAVLSPGDKRLILRPAGGVRF
jgi:hypothetical protein